MKKVMSYRSMRKERDKFIIDCYEKHHSEYPFEDGVCYAIQADLVRDFKHKELSHCSRETIKRIIHKYAG